MRKAANKAQRKGIEKKSRSLQKHFFEKREIGSHEATKITLSMPLRKSNR